MPLLWLITDERISNAALFFAISRLPRGSGIIFRHHATEYRARLALFRAVQKCARARRVMLLLSGSPQLARRWRADGVHGRNAGSDRRLRRSAPVHNMREMQAAQRAGAGILFVSPVFQTRTHPGGRTLGPVRFGLLARKAQRPVIALGGMTKQRARITKKLGAAGWAAIDGLSQD